MDTIPEIQSDDGRGTPPSTAPLSGGGSNFRTHRLVFKENRILIAPTKRYCAFPLVFMLFGGVFLAISTAKAAPSVFLFFALALLLFGLLVFLYMAFGTRPVFELTTRRFFPKGIPKNADDPMALYTEGIALSDTEGLQLLSKTCTGNKGARYLCYELNLKMRSGERIPLMNHGGLKGITEDARKLSEALSLPLEDAMASTAPQMKESFSSHSQAKATGFISILFGPVLALAGGALLTFSLFVPAWRWHCYKSWMEVPAEIKRFELVVSGGSGSKQSYHINVDYTYAIEEMPGKTFQGSRYNAWPSIFSASSYRRQYEQLAPTLKPGSMTVCYVDPNDYSNSVLFRNFPLEAIPFAVPGAITLFLGFWIPVSIRRRQREMEQRKGTHQPRP